MNECLWHTETREPFLKEEEEKDFAAGTALTLGTSPSRRKDRSVLSGVLTQAHTERGGGLEMCSFFFKQYTLDS